MAFFARFSERKIIKNLIKNSETEKPAKKEVVSHEKRKENNNYSVAQTA